MGNSDTFGIMIVCVNNVSLLDRDVGAVLAVLALMSS